MLGNKLRVNQWLIGRLEDYVIQRMDVKIGYWRVKVSMGQWLVSIALTKQISTPSRINASILRIFFSFNGEIRLMIE